MSHKSWQLHPNVVVLLHTFIFYSVPGFLFILSPLPLRRRHYLTREWAKVDILCHSPTWYCGTRGKRNDLSPIRSKKVVFSGWKTNYDNDRYGSWSFFTTVLPSASETFPSFWFWNAPVSQWPLLWEDNSTLRRFPYPPRCIQSSSPI